jgi:hypothetical protein
MSKVPLPLNIEVLVPQVVSSALYKTLSRLTRFIFFWFLLGLSLSTDSKTCARGWKVCSKVHFKGKQTLLALF